MRIPSGRPVFRALGWTLALPLAVWALWLVVAQVFLLTPLFGAVLNTASPTVHIRYRWAWSVWPGTVHMRGMVLTSQDRKVQWELQIDRLTTAVALSDLPRRMFHATSVRADGVAFLLRRRIPKYEVTPDKLEGLPLIEGFPDVPLGEEGPDYDVPEWNYRLWSVWLQDTQATAVRQIQVDRLRVEGDAHLAGAFYLKPIRQVLLDPAILEGTRLVVKYGAARVLTDLQLALRLKLGPFDPRGMRAETFLRTVDADVDGKGRFEGLEALQRLLDAGEMKGGNGPVSLGLHVQAGQVVPPASFSAELARLTLREGGVAATVSTLSAALDLPAGPPPNEARAHVVARGIATAFARLPALETEIEGIPTDLARLTPPRRLRIDLRGGRIEEAKSLAEAFGLRNRVQEGSGTFSAHLEGPPDRLAGSARLALEGLRGKAASATLTGNLAIDVEVQALDPSRGADLSGTRIEIESAHEVHDSGEEDTRPGWWARIGLPRLHLRFAAKDNEPVADADLAGRCRDARPIVGLYAREADLPAFVRGLFAMDDLSLRGSAIAGRSWLVLRKLAADGDGASVHAALRVDPRGSNGGTLLTVRGLSVGVEVSPAGKSVHLLGPGGWFADKAAQIDPARELGSLPRARRRPPPRRAARVQTAD